MRSGHAVAGGSVVVRSLHSSGASLIKTVLHLHVMLCRVQQRAVGDWYICTIRHCLAIEHNDKARDALHTRDSEDALIDAREENRPAERPALPVIAAFERMKILEDRLCDALIDFREIGVVSDYGFH